MAEKVKGVKPKVCVISIFLRRDVALCQAFPFSAAGDSSDPLGGECLLPFRALRSELVALVTTLLLLRAPWLIGDVIMM